MATSSATFSLGDHCARPPSSAKCSRISVEGVPGIARRPGPRPRRAPPTPPLHRRSTAVSYRSCAKTRPVLHNIFGGHWKETLLGLEIDTHVAGALNGLMSEFVFLTVLCWALASGPKSQAQTNETDAWALARQHCGAHRFSTLFTAQDVRRYLASDERLKAAIDWCKQTGITKVYVESFRDNYQAERPVSEHAKKEVAAAGFEVSGCVTTTGVGKPSTGWKDVAPATPTRPRRTGSRRSSSTRPGPVRRDHDRRFLVHRLHLPAVRCGAAGQKRSPSAEQT